MQMQAQGWRPLAVPDLLVNRVGDAETCPVVRRQDRDAGISWRQVVLRILDERKRLIVEARRQVESEALRLDRTPAVARERSDHREAEAFRELDERVVRPEGERRNDGEDLRLAHQPPQ